MWKRLRYLLPSVRRREDAELDEELRSLAEMAEADGADSRKALGNLVLAKEDARAVSKWQWFEGLLADVRYAIRVLRRDRAFTALTLVTLALCIGANAAIFSLVDAVVIRTLPVHDPDNLAEFRSGSVSYWSYQRYASLSRDWFSDVLATGGSEDKMVDLGGGPFRASVELVSGNYFETLGVRARTGRLIAPEDDKREAPSFAAVISDRFWRRHFGGGDHAIGRKLRVQGIQLTITGVAPEEFFGVAVGAAADLWVPLALQPVLNPNRPWLDSQNTNFLVLMGRLKEGVSMSAAADALTPVMHDIDLTRAGKDADAQFTSLVRKERMRLTPATYGISRLRARFSQPLRIVFCMVGIALFLGCINILNLQLARASERRREFAVRLAIGAGRGRILRQLLVESTLLTSAAAATGLVLSQPAAQTLASLITQRGEPIVLNSRIDESLLWFVCALAAVVTLISGLLPAWQATRGALWTAVQSGGQSVTSGRGRRWLRYSLVSVQSGLSLFLVAAASIFGVSLLKLLNFDIGLDRSNLAIVDVDPTEAGYERQRMLAMAESVASRLRSIPGVVSVTYSQNGLFSGRSTTNLASTEGFTQTEFNARKVWLDMVGPGFVTTLKSRLLDGRDVTERDHAGAPKVAVVSESFAKHFFGDRNPLGRIVALEPNGSSFEVVGLVRDMRVEGVREDPRRWMYIPAQQAERLWGTRFIVRTLGTPQRLFESFRRAVRQENPQLPVVSIHSGDELLGRTLDRDRLLANLAVGFGVLSLIVAAVGIYGLLSYDVVKRMHEVGVRMALGAKRGSIVRLVLKETILMCVLGMAAGGAAAVACGKYVESLLFGLQPSDPRVIGGAAVSLVCVALIAAGIPAFRAGSVNPVSALRHD